MSNSPSLLGKIRYLWATCMLLPGVAGVALCAGDQACSAQVLQTERPIAFPVSGPIRGSELVLKSPATVLIGEMHGTWETPLLVASLIRSASGNQVPTVLCLEISATQQPLLDQFLQSDGGEAAVAALLRGPHWSGTDGRASVGQFAMLELVRRLNRQDRVVRVVAIDIAMPTLDPSDIDPTEIRQLVKKRDRAMAEKVLTIRKKSPKAHVLALAGNVHTKVTKGLPWDAEYVPMGWYVDQETTNVVSLNVQSSGGQAWVATDQGVGPMRLRGVDRGREPFIELFDQPKDGYHGVFYVGESSAAPPAKGLANSSRRQPR